MGSKETQRWKSAERLGAKLFSKYKLESERISRSGNFGESTYDIKVKDHPELKVDSKYSQAGFRTNRMLDIVQSKYCSEKTDIPVLLTKGYKEIGMKATVDAEYLAMLLSFWLGYGSKEELEDIYFGKKK